MRVSEVLSEGVEQFLKLAPMAADHMEDMDNPHNVTKETVGLGNVTNDQQAKASDFNSHKEATVLDHPEKSVTGGKLADGAVTERALAKGAVTAEKIASDAVGANAIKDGSIGYRHMEASVQKDIANKVDKAEGMGLSQNSFTDAEKVKLSTIKLTGEDGSFEINTESLLTKALPLQLQKTGDAYVYEKEISVTSRAGNILGTDVDEINGDYILAYTSPWNTYDCYWIDGTGKPYTASLPSETVAHSLYRGYLFAALLQDDGTVTVRRQAYAAASGTAIGNFTLSKTGDIEFKKVYSNATTSTTSGNVWIVYYVHTTTATTLVVDKFALGQAAPVWSYTKSMKAKANFTPPLTANDTVYDTRVNMTAMDLDQNLYVSIINVSGGTDSYGIIRLSPAGEVTGKYFPVTSASNAQIYQDIAIVDNKLYAFATTSVVMADLATGKTYTIWKGNAARLRGITPTLGGVHIATEATDGTTKLYYVQGGKLVDCQSTKKAEARAQTLPGQYHLCRFMNDKMYLVKWDTTNTALKLVLYVPCTLYTAI